MLLIARTNARGSHALDEAIRNGQLYSAAGADIIFPGAFLSVEEYASFAAEVPGLKMFNMGGCAKALTTPRLPIEDVQRVGYGLITFPLASIRPGVRDRGTAHEIERIAALEGHPVETRSGFAGIGTVRVSEGRYLDHVRIAKRYETDAGYQPVLLPK